MSDPDSEAGRTLKGLTAGPEAAGQRLDQWLASALGGDMSRSRVQQLIRQGAVTVKGAVVAEPKRKLAAGDTVSVEMPEPAPAEPLGEDIPLDIIYEDDELIVIDKPPGLVVHPGAGNWTGTLVNALIHHCGDTLSGIGGVRRPGIVHRLDKDTTGLMVVAKNDRAHKRLANQFADHGRTGPLERGYRAIVWGVPALPYGLVDAPIGRSPTSRLKMAVLKTGGKEAITHYTVQERFGDPKNPIASLIDLRLETGRTHQIRVHMAAMAHPLIGDQEYGKGFLTKLSLIPEPARSAISRFHRQALHAWLLGFEHPTSGETLHFESEPPQDLAELIEAFNGL